MHHTCHTALATTAPFVVIIFALLTAPWRIACAIDPLPAEIPEVDVTADESIRKAAEAIERIENDEERLRTLSRALYDLRSLGREKLLPLLAAVEREAGRRKDNNWLSLPSESLAVVDPELLLKLSEDITDERVRDYCLAKCAGGFARIDVPKSRRVAAMIKNPERRAEAWVGVFSGRLELADIKAIWTEILATGWPPNRGDREYVLGYALARAAPKNFPEVADFARQQLKPDEAVLTLCHMSGQLRYFENQPELADRALTAAAELVPTCEDRAAAVKWLLHYHYAGLDRERAAALFHEYVVPLALRQPDQQWQVRGLADGGIDFALRHAKKAADALDVPEERLIRSVLGNAAVQLEPEVALAWLKEQPASPTRELAVVCIAGGFAERTSKTIVNSAVHQKWVDLLSKEVLGISDPHIRREACEQILWLTRAPKSKAKISLPAAIRSEYGRLWDDPSAAPERPRDTWQIVIYSRLLPEKMQEREISRLWKERENEGAAAVLDQSSLEAETRQSWYDKLLEQARATTKTTQRAARLTGIAKCLKDENQAQSVAVLWEALELVKPFNPKRGYHDVVGYLGSVTPPANPDEALTSTFVDFRGGGQPAIDALWDFAHKLAAAEEREPLLEALAKVLVEANQSARAAGVTTLLADPARQARVWIEIARETHGVQDEHR